MILKVRSVVLWSTVNVDILACINFRRFAEMGNFECTNCTKICTARKYLRSQYSMVWTPQDHYSNQLG